MGDPITVRARRWVRFGALYAAILGAEFLAKKLPSRWPSPRRAWKPGVSVLIPERGTPDLLAATLEAAVTALARIDEPTQLVVVVNGAPRADYAALERAHPTVEWRFHDQPLGFNGAVAEGLGAVRHDAVYLLNSDMRLEPDAIAALLPYRQPHVFAITSQIFFTDPARRREETGWSAFRVVGAKVEMYERDPEPGSTLARGNLYPGGGSSLLRTRELKRYVRDSACYSPFYWEDADWGARAWADGWEVLFCPASRAHHEHRGTVKRYYDAAYVDHVIARNALLFELRHHWTDMDSKRTLIHVSAWDERTQREVATLRNAWGIFKVRLAAQRARRRGLDFHAIHDKFYPLPAGPRWPRVLLVSPFALFPPAHGGARRVAELTARVCERAEVVLLSDERSAYTSASEPWFERFAAVHLVEGRGDVAGQAVEDLPTRLARHAHPKLRAELARLVASYAPDVVQVEFMELAALAAPELALTPLSASPSAADNGVRASYRDGVKWVLDLHDVYLDGGSTDAAQRALLARFDALIACSAEDAALLAPLPATLVPNGGADRLDRYEPSSDAANLLFMGPFRYAPNRLGIEAFLATCWPRIRATLPRATITILGGAESGPYAQEPAFRQPGVELVSRFVDPAPYLERCALTINPQLGIRGSALKLIESLLAGRACVSTEDGARGFADAGLDGLVRVRSIDELGDAVLALLRDDARRHAIEKPDADRIHPYTWDGIAEKMLELYD